MRASSATIIATVRVDLTPDQEAAFARVGAAVDDLRRSLSMPMVPGEVYQDFFDRVHDCLVARTVIEHRIEVRG